MFVKKNKSFRAVVILLITTIFMIPFGGCSSKNANGSNSPSKITPTIEAKNQVKEDPIDPNLNPSAKLRVWFSLDPKENDMLQQIADEFTKETKIKIEVLDSNFFSIRQKFPLTAETPQKPDIVFMQSADLGAIVESGYARPIEFVDDKIKQRYSEIAFDSFMYNGKLYGVGYSTDAYGIVYNKKLVNTIPKTWDEYFKVAEKNTILDSSGKPTHYGTLVCPDNYWFMYPIIKSYGGYYFGKSENGAYNLKDIGIDNKGTADAVKYLLELKNKKLTTQEYIETDNNISQKFALSQVDMFIYGLWDAQKYKSAGIDYGYAPLPNNNDGTPSRPLTTVQGFVINKYSDNPKEAEAFLKYMMRDSNQQKLYEAANGGNEKTGARNTCSKAVLASDYVQSSEILKSLAAVGMTGEVFPTNPEATVIWNSAKNALDSIFFKNAPVEAKLKEFSDKVKSDIVKMKK